ncbi:MAG: hypothetical protein L6R41_004656 [Letrouitia leprolyta]|nr:MAG: hypothetical protein L6R41_004656 [Letrouitia leprolyta]
MSHSPPKTVNVMRSREFHGFEQASVNQAVPLQDCRLQAQSASLYSQSNGSYDASTSEALQQQQQNRRRTQSLSDGIRRGHLEHPPGYSQNPYAMEMTAEQRFTRAQENESEQGLPMPNNIDITSSTVVDLWRRARNTTESLVAIVNDWLSDGF